MNKLDSELVAEALVAAGHEIVADEAEANAILFNTCSVRDHAEQRVLSRIAHLRARKKAEPDLRLGVMGCMAQRLARELFDKAPHLDLVCGTRKFPQIAELLEQSFAGPVLAVEEESLTAPGTLDAHGRSLFSGIQAYISIMRGCNNFCTYCIVPYVRGREESRPIAAVVGEARALVSRGAKEITLLGQNVDAYGKDIGSSLAELLREVDKVEDFVRMRFVTSHPKDITEELVKTVAALPRVCNHFHMPAQSGSTKMLKAMNRGYTREEYDRRLEIIAKHCPGALVTSDFIVGFPDEADEDHEQSVELIKAAKFQNSYVFKYSPRPGTVAEKKLVDNAPEEVKKQRNHELLSAQEEVNCARSASLVGSTQEIMVEGISRRDKTRMTGRTSNNLICVFPAPEDAEALVGKLVTLKINACGALTLIGELQSR
jgi:tRNA-2-methylthio-N6-dimethylallyladenosine synthase